MIDKADYKIIPVSIADVSEWILRKHYSHKLPAVSMAFAIYKKNHPVGICTFGSPANMNLNDLGGFRTLELNRLVVEDGCKKNITSYFLGSILRQIQGPIIIISYADRNQGHIGYIYQATNWTYTGQSERAVVYEKNGTVLHSKTFFDMFGTNKKEKAGELGYKIIKTMPKHRYFYFIGTKTQKKQMAKSIPFKMQPYPKGESKRYDASCNIEKQILLF